jgi:protein-disulfide reductase (glutathione)
MQQSNARKAFKKLSEYFVMVNTADDDEPYEEEYRPDGKYVPRLLFLDKNGDHLSEIKNKKAEYKNYAYYYSSPADILVSFYQYYDNIIFIELDEGRLKTL